MNQQDLYLQFSAYSWDTQGGNNQIPFFGNHSKGENIMARRSRKETLQSKIDIAEAKIAELQEKTVALQQEIDKYNDELVEIDKAEKEKADKAAMDDLVKAF